MRRATLAALLAVVALAAPTHAKPVPKTSMVQIEQQVMCALCKTPLAVANGPQADAERAFIGKLIAQGKSEQQIKDALVVQYGTRVLALPREQGFNLVVYLVPIAAVAGALVLLALLLPRWRRRSRARGGGRPLALGPELSAEDAQRLDEDLARYDG